MSEIGKQQDGRKKYDQRKSHGQFLGAGQKAFCKRRTHSYLAEPRRRAKGLRDYIEVAAGVKEDALTERICHMRYPSSKRGNTPENYRHNAGRAPQQWSETLIDPFFESKVPNSAGVEDKTGDALLRIARKAHGANVPGKNVAYGWPKSLCFFLQSRQTQISVLQHHAVNRVDFLADVSACILAEFRIARRKRRRGFKYVRLFAPEALLQSLRLFRAGGQESYLNLIAPGNVGNVEAGFSCRLQRMKLGVANVDLQLAILHQDFVEVIIFPVPINSRERGHLLGAKWRRATAHCSFFRSGWFGSFQMLGEKAVLDLSGRRRRICVRRVA